MRMKRVILSLVALVGVGLLSAVPVWAHHAFAAEFDADRPVAVVGTVAKVELVNPHSWIHVDVVRADGEGERGCSKRGDPFLWRGAASRRTTCRSARRCRWKDIRAKGVPRRASGRLLKFADGVCCLWVRRARAPRPTAPIRSSAERGRGSRRGGLMGRVRCWCAPRRGRFGASREQSVGDRLVAQAGAR